MVVDYLSPSPTGLRWGVYQTGVRSLAIVKAVREQHQPVSKVATRFGISRQRIYKILADYDAGGANTIAPKSRTPHTHPHAIPDTLRKHIIDMRKELTKAGLDAGPDTIAFHLEQQGLRVPSTSTIRRIIGADPRKVDTSGGQYDGIMLTHAALASNSFGDRYPHQE